MKGTVHSTFAMNPSKADKKKIAALWPLELNDLVLAAMTMLLHQILCLFLLYIGILSGFIFKSSSM